MSTAVHHARDHAGTSSVQPRPHQVTALSALTRALAVHDRAQLLMACGTGKTLVGFWYAQAAQSDLVLVLVPTLALVAQTLREWRRAAGPFSPFSALVVCSDPSTSTGEAERSADGDDTIGVDPQAWKSMHARVTTDPASVARFLKQHNPETPQVVFATYHSAPVVAAAQAASGAVFDLEICDEAHRLAGRPRAEFRAAFAPRAIVARKRIFMTATQLVLAGDDDVSMADPQLFGPVAHTLSFGQAIDAGLLTDYRVLVVAAREETVASHRSQTSTISAALMNAVDTCRVRRLLSFHSRVARAWWFADTLNGTASPAGRRVLARQVSGKMPTRQRISALEWLAATHATSGPHDDDTVRVISNARCLSEGVDVPEVDGIMIADPRTSMIDIIQIIGRVLRPAPGKTRGTIILPVALPTDGDDDSALASSAFAHVWAVLRALRLHDQRLAVEVDRAFGAVTGGTPRRHRAPERIEFILPGDFDISAVQLRLVHEVGSAWERNYALLEEWSREHGGRLLSRVTMVRGVHIGEWAEQQRIAQRRGLLAADRASRLERVPGWAWDKSEARWDLTYEVVHSFAEEHGTVADSTAGPSVFTGLKDHDQPQRHLGVWQAVQRQAYRLGTLSERKVRLLEALPGWAWDAHLPDDDIAMVEALRVFVEFEKHADVPDDHLEDGLRLGSWCWAVRRRKVTGRLAPALEYEILAATPSRFRASERFRWEKAETQWRLAYFALRQFSQREGHTRVTRRHVEQLPDAPVNLQQWTAVQRYNRRRGSLDDRHAALLEALPCWQWDIDLQTLTASDPVDLPDGVRHGSWGAYYTRKCECAPCLDARRTKHRDHLAKRRQLKNPTPARRTRQHLLGLEADGARRTTLASAAGVPLGVVRKLLAGDVDRIEREHELRLLAVTRSMVAQSQSRTGSRGRTTAAHTERIDSKPTWARLDDLASRGFGNTWISRELGYAGALQLKRGATISRRIADQVQDLHERIGDITMPALAKSTRRPSLTGPLQTRAGLS